MSRYIDADALIDKLTLMPIDLGYREYADFLGLINEQPTAEVEKVVRCKDCKYYLHSNEVCGLIDTRLHFYETDKVWTEDCFCSWAERREDEQIH